MHAILYCLHSISPLYSNRVYSLCARIEKSTISIVYIKKKNVTYSNI